MTTKFYEIDITPGVHGLGGHTSFRRQVCIPCGRSVVVQVADLEVEVDSDITELPSVILVPGGQLLMSRRLWHLLESAGAQAGTKSVVVRRDPWSYVQVLPSAQATLSASSVRIRVHECSACGGLSRLAHDRSWMVESASPTDALLATIVGAGQIIVISEMAVSLLAAQGVDVARSPLFPVATPGPNDPNGWGEL